VLDKILEAAQRLNGIAHITPVLTSTQLNELTGASIFLKCENFQHGGAFKFRGAYNTISQLDEAQKQIGIITHSSGNHAQAVAKTGKLLGIKTVIVMPENAPQVKVNATRGYGAEVVFCKPTQEARVDTVNQLIAEFGYQLVHPFDNDNIIAGAATASVELFEQVDDLDYILAPVGGGGLISGTGLYTKLSNKATKVIAAEPYGADDAYRSITNKTHITDQQPKTIADGLRTTLSELTLGYIRDYVDEIIRVSDQETIKAMRYLFERMKIVVEPSGAVPVAAVINHPERFANKQVGIIISGGNLDMGSLFDNLQPLDKA